MGRGGTTKQTGVTRHEPSYSTDLTAVGAGGGPAPEMANMCLAGFSEDLLLDGPSASGAKQGLEITLVPGVPGTINIMSGAARLGVYDGDQKSRLQRCMRKKYIYRGVIDSLMKDGASIYARCSIYGLGLT